MYQINKYIQYILDENSIDCGQIVFIALFEMIAGIYIISIVESFD